MSLTKDHCADCDKDREIHDLVGFGGRDLCWKCIKIRSCNSHLELVQKLDKQKQCIACMRLFQSEGTQYQPPWGPICKECADKVGLTEVD